MADKIGKYKVSKREFDEFNAKLDIDGGTLNGDLSVEGDIDVLNTISASSGHIMVNGDFLFQTDNDGSTTNIISTTGIGSTLGIYNNLLYVDGTNLGIGTVEPSGKLEVVGTVVLSDLPTTEPSTAGELCVSGSDAVGKSKNLVVFTG